MSSKPRIVFAGTPDFSVYPLEGLLTEGYDVVAVYTQPDRPAGRGRKTIMSPVKQMAMKHNVPVFQPQNFKQQSDVDQLVELEADLMIVVAYGLLLPLSVLQAPRLGCINIHASLLPRWRGAAPIQRAIAAGDAETGITIMQMDEGLDTGDMMLKKTCPIESNDTGGLLHDKLALLGVEAMLEALPAIFDGSVSVEKQDDSLTSYAAKLSKSEAAINWTEPAIQIERKIRAFNPWPVAYTDYHGENMRVWEASLSEGEGLAGQVISADKQGIEVAATDGSVVIQHLQVPGKKAMAAADFINAHDVTGVILGQNKAH